MQVEATNNNKTYEKDNITYTLDGTKVTVTNGKSATGDVEILDEVTIEDNQYDVTAIGIQAFLDNANIASITIPSSVTSIGDNAFEDCGGLTTVTIPSSVTSIGEYAFHFCNNLTSITIPTSVKSIGEFAFDGCGGLTTVNIPSSITSISNGVFANCTNLTSITIPTSVTEIGDNAFSDCTNLTSITIPTSVTSIGVSAFSGCSNLKTLIIQGEASIGKDAFKSCTSLSNIYVVSETMKDTLVTYFDGDSDMISKIKVGLPTDGSASKSTFVYIPPAWVPTEPADIYRHSLKGTEEIHSEVVAAGTDQIYMVNEVQGQLFIDAISLVQGDYTLARTYTIFVNDTLVYNTDNKVRIVLQIPETLQKENRNFRMFCVTENGAVVTLPDLDQDPTTITFETNRFYAFALGYIDEQ